MYFRPLPILTLLGVPILAALIALGVWQVQRAGWKADLVESFKTTAGAPPLSIARACQDGLDEGVVIVPPTAEGKALRVFGHDASGAAGWRVFQAAPVCGRSTLIESGFEALDIGGPGGRLPEGARADVVIDRYVVEPWPEKGMLAAPNAPDRNEWHWFDASAMKAALGAPDLETRFVLSPFAGVPAFLSRTPPETHIGYAATWFGMAVAFLVIYAVFHARVGRLCFGRTRT